MEHDDVNRNVELLESENIGETKACGKSKLTPKPQSAILDPDRLLTHHQCPWAAQEYILETSQILIHKLPSQDFGRFQRTFRIQAHKMKYRRGYILTTPCNLPLYLALEHKIKGHYLGQQRPFHFSFFHPTNGRLMMEIQRTFSMSSADVEATFSTDGVCTEYMNRTNVILRDGICIGHICEKWLFCTPLFHVYEENPFTLSMVIKGVAGSHYLLRRIPDFSIYLAQENYLSMGTISQIKSSGTFFHSDVMSVEFPKELRPNLKMLLVGGALQLRVSYFERKFSRYDYVAFGVPLVIFLLSIPIFVLVIILSI